MLQFEGIVDIWRHVRRGGRFDESRVAGFELAASHFGIVGGDYVVRKYLQLSRFDHLKYIYQVYEQLYYQMQIK